MKDQPWWTSVSTAELLVLRRRLLVFLALAFGDDLKAEVEDIVQCAFVDLFQRHARVTPHGDGLYRYLKKSACHTALDRIKETRKHRGRSPVSISNRKDRLTHENGGPTGADKEQIAEEHENIWEVFRALGDLDRLVLWSHVVDGKSVRAVARELNLNWHSVARILDDALRRFRLGLSPWSRLDPFTGETKEVPGEGDT